MTREFAGCKIYVDIRIRGDTVSLTKRVELLFDPKLYDHLEELAQSRGESVAALIRSAVARQYLQPSLEKKRAAFKNIVGEDMDFGSWEEVKSSIEKEVVKHFEAP